MVATAEHWDWSLIRTRCRAEALRILRRPHDAEDAVQEALARAWRSRHACRNPEAPIPWCLQITRNEAIRLIGRRRPPGADAPLDEDGYLEDVGAGQERGRVLLRVDVHRALENLPPHERQLIALRYLHDYSHSEIAAMLEIPEATARVRLHRVHKRLETLL
ncbi:MAG TPA: sigma-70 family RNA polymerase sigma factor [Solirubrobacteraceae bacterium]|nr:sigma-70 family RNA polymerase sigma factor [Solirubrobacteraceae bacterium]